VSGEFESDPSRENIDHFRSHHMETAGSIYNATPSFGSDSDGDRKVFLLGQNDVLGDQIEKEIAQAAIVEIARSKKVPKDVEKATGKKHISPRDRNSDLIGFDEGGDDTISRATTLCLTNNTE
jgi:hypothetical protein